MLTREKLGVINDGGKVCLPPTSSFNSCEEVMGWQGRRSYAARTGRTLRRTAFETRTHHKERGFLTKNVLSNDLNFTDAEIRNCLGKFSLEDGLYDESVVKESRANRGSRFAWAGSSSQNLLYSLGKRKRWLIPDILKEKIPKDNDSEADLHVVLVERVTSNDVWQRSPRLSHGDCSGVCEGKGLRTPKKRKFAHVGDLRSNSFEKTEILYEVNRTEPAPSWPNCREIDWREWRYRRDDKKARNKTKGIKNKRRWWGGYGSKELQLKGTQTSDERSLACEETTEERLHEESFNPIGHCDKSSSAVAFDIGKYMFDVVTSNFSRTTVLSSGKRSECTPINCLNPASSKCHRKASVVYIDPGADLGCHDNPEPLDHSAPTVLEEDLPPDSSSGMVSVDVRVQRELLHTQHLYDHFGEQYNESNSLPWRFSVSPVYLSSKFVFTCCDLKDSSDRSVVNVTVAVVSDALPSEKGQALKEFISSSFENFLIGYKPKIELSTSNSAPQLGDQPVTCHPASRRKGVMPFSLLYTINKWKSKTLLPSDRLDELMHCISATDKHKDKTDITPRSSVLSIPDNVSCGICYNDFHNGKVNESASIESCCTALKSCCHWFCNNCWKSYLTTQLHHGNTAIKCPEYDCDIPVDDITLMGIVPGLFPKYSKMRKEKALELNTRWQWCPGDKCNLAVMVTTGKLESVQCKGVATAKMDVRAIPVNCSCGLSWCFACQNEPHWPASCAEAAFFREQTKAYEELVRVKSRGIKSVHVKRCPMCNYPIEKNQGCPHMRCTMCTGEFCWTCLSKWEGHGYNACTKKIKGEEEVELISGYGSIRFNRHLRAVVANCQARATSVLIEKYTVLEKLESSLLHHEGSITHFDDSCQAGAPSVLLRKYKVCDVSRYLKAALDFKFQAHFVVEGASILMAVSKSRYCHDKLTVQLSTLLFLIERLECRAKARQLCSEADRAHFQMLLEAGKHCLHSIRKLCIKIHKK